MLLFLKYLKNYLLAGSGACQMVVMVVQSQAVLLDGETRLDDDHYEVVETILRK